MPTLEDLENINKTTEALEPKIAAAMRVIFLLTEQDSQYMNDYICVAADLEPELSDTVRDILRPYNLVDKNGHIPKDIKQAIQNAIKTRHLEVRKDGHKTRCTICGGPHQTENHHIWASQHEDTRAKDPAAELEKYADILNAFKSGGLSAAEKILNDMNMTMNHKTCFCGSSNHSSVDHLRQLVDQESEI